MALIIDRSARVSGRPAVPLLHGGRVLKGLVWVSYSVIIRLSLGKLLLVNLLQVVKRTNTPLITLTNGAVDRPWVFGSWVQIPHP